MRLSQTSGNEKDEFLKVVLKVATILSLIRGEVSMSRSYSSLE